MNPSYYDVNIGSVTRSSGKGNTNASLHNIIRSKNWLGGPPHLPIMKENTGLVFIAPPDLNLNIETVGHVREFSPLLTEDPYSLGATIRDMLDPRSAMKRPRSRLNDPKYPFMGILDNTLTSLDGWPDYVMDEFISEPGKAGSTYMTAKGRIKKGQHFTLNATHTNLPGDAINQIYSYLALWQDHVHRWSVSPHMVNVRHNRLDYAQRIYRFIFDSSGTKLNQFTMCGYCFPKAGSQGAVMNYNTEGGVNDGYDTISASWNCVGVFHNDPIVLDCFNKLIERFNPKMKDSYREQFLVKVGAEESANSLSVASTFQYHGYPRINLQTLEFEIWVDKNIYLYLKEGLISEEVMMSMVRRRDEDLANAISTLAPEEYQTLIA